MCHNQCCLLLLTYPKLKTNILKNPLYSILHVCLFFYSNNGHLLFKTLFSTTYVQHKKCHTEKVEYNILNYSIALFWTQTICPRMISEQLFFMETEVKTDLTSI